MRGYVLRECELKVKQNKIELVSHCVHPLHTLKKKNPNFLKMYCFESESPREQYSFAANTQTLPETCERPRSIVSFDRISFLSRNLFTSSCSQSREEE